MNDDIDFREGMKRMNNNKMTKEDIDFIITDLRKAMTVIAGTIQLMRREKEGM